MSVSYHFRRSVGVYQTHPCDTSLLIRCVKYFVPRAIQGPAHTITKAGVWVRWGWKPLRLPTRTGSECGVGIFFNLLYGYLSLETSLPSYGIIMSSPSRIIYNNCSSVFRKLSDVIGEQHYRAQSEIPNPIPRHTNTSSRARSALKRSTVINSSANQASTATAAGETKLMFTLSSLFMVVTW